MGATPHSPARRGRSSATEYVSRIRVFCRLPKIGMTLAPLLLAQAVKPAFERIIRDGYEFDLIDAHYFYPDGVAAVMLGLHFGRPVVITARGSDLTLLPRYWFPRRMIQWAARNAAGLITVCAALKQALVGLGVAAERVDVLRNGVDLQLFQPVDRESERRRLGFTRTTLLSVGNLVPVKGHDLTIRALALLPDVDLIIAGDGPERAALTSLAQSLAVGPRVKFAGVLAQQELRYYYGAADALVLSSSREGWANVLLESMACGLRSSPAAYGGLRKWSPRLRPACSCKSARRRLSPPPSSTC
jgi:glycosyltransferase involved in cell wall biosynthesis